MWGDARGPLRDTSCSVLVSVLLSQEVWGCIDGSKHEVQQTPLTVHSCSGN